MDACQIDVNKMIKLDFLCKKEYNWLQIETSKELIN